MNWIDWWFEADWIVRGVFVLLGILSLTSWSVMLSRGWRFHVLLKGESGRSPGLGMPSAVFPAARGQFLALPPEGRDTLRAQLLREIRLELESGLTILATIGNSAPFIGLFGTVWGIMNALHGLGGEALNMEMVTGPVAEALVATAAGLFAAVPAVAGYNYLVRRLRRLMSVIERNALILTEPGLEDA